MTKDGLRSAFSTAAVLSVLVAACAPGCGGGTKRGIPFAPEAGAAGEAGTSGSSGSGRVPSAGNAGSPSVGGSNNADEDGGVGGALPGSMTGGATNDAGQPGVEAAGAAGQPLELPPDIDAGVDCLSPSAEPALTAASAGLPASGLALWVRADRGVYMTTAHRVCAWADQSGHGRLLTNSSSDDRPLWNATGVGGRPAIHFDNTGRYLYTNELLGMAPTSARTFIAVVQLVNTTARFQTLTQGQANSPGTYLTLEANTFNTAGSRECVYAMNNSFDSGLATSTAPRVHVYTLGTMTPGTPLLGAIDYRVNGATQTLTRNAGGLGNGNFEDFSGANYTAIGSGPDAFIAEALFYDRALSVTERASVEVALEARYAIQ
jgi:hypothetical protein